MTKIIYIAFVSHLVLINLSLSANNKYDLFFGSFQSIGLAQKGVLTIGLSATDYNILKSDLFKLQTAYTFNKFLYAAASYQKSFSNANAEKDFVTNTTNTSVALGGYYFKPVGKNGNLLLKKLSNKYTEKRGLVFDVALSYVSNKNNSIYNFDLNKSKSEIALNKYGIVAGVHYSDKLFGLSFSVNTTLLDFRKGKIGLNGPNDLIIFFNLLNNNKPPSTYGFNFNVWTGIKQVKLKYSLNKDFGFKNRYYYYYFERFYSEVSLCFFFNIKKKHLKE